MEFKFIDEILSQQAVVTSLTLVITSFCTYLVTKLTGKIKADEAYQREQEEMSRSNKRSALRNEYLQIFNSREFTWEQKYHMSRDLVRDYYDLNGNHYIHEVDEELFAKMEEERHEAQQ